MSKQILFSSRLLIITLVATFVAGFSAGMVIAGLSSWECTAHAECDQ